MKVKSDREYAKILYGLVATLPPAKVAAALTSFVQYLGRENVMRRAARIVTAFARYAKEKEGIEEVKVISAHELSQAMIKEIKESFGEKTEITTALDTDLIGGFVALTRSERLDASVKGRLNRFATHLLS